jgi:nicotinamidase-related amidase
MNQVLAWYARRAFRAEIKYPASSTALVLLNAQRGFFADAEADGGMLEVVRLARELGWVVVHAPAKPAVSLRFPTEAHERLSEAVRRGSASVFDVLRSEVLLDESARLSGFAGTGLEAELRSRGVERIVLAGPLAELRVDSTLRDAVQLDFHATVARDACPTGPTVRDRLRYRRTWGRYAHAIVDNKELARAAKP